MVAFFILIVSPCMSWPKLRRGRLIICANSWLIRSCFSSNLTPEMSQIADWILRANSTRIFCSDFCAEFCVLTTVLYIYTGKWKFMENFTEIPRKNWDSSAVSRFHISVTAFWLWLLHLQLTEAAAGNHTNLDIHCTTILCNWGKLEALQLR